MSAVPGGLRRAMGTFRIASYAARQFSYARHRESQSPGRDRRIPTYLFPLLAYEERVASKQAVRGDGQACLALAKLRTGHLTICVSTINAETTMNSATAPISNE